MAPLEPWEKVLVAVDKFEATTHGSIACTECHGGVQSSVKEDAHEGMNPTPSKEPLVSCGNCHKEQVDTYGNALHNTQAGYWTQIDARSVPENHPALETMFGNHCSTCHTTCGECHVAQPQNVGGGLFSGHVFEKTPPMTRSCTACHGSRVGNEYLGKNEGFPGDVHFREERMSCVKCHTGKELHGSATPADHRYDGEEMPTCLSCHPDAAPGKTDNPMHNQHSDTLSCQVCHSITYTSCDGCHVAVSEKSGLPYFETENTYHTFAIGKNPLISPERPYSYVPLRHTPISETSYEFYGENLLPNFSSKPTWQYATPHNIQLQTPQNASCAACHDNPDLFLTGDKVAENEIEANKDVIVTDTIPSSTKLVDLAAGAGPMPADHKDLACQNCCKVCHSVGVRSALIYPTTHKSFSETSCSGCHKLPE